MLNIRKGIKKLISYVMVFVLTVMVVGSAAVILSGISVYAWFDGSGYEGIYIFGSKPLTDYVNISNMTDDNMLPHANEPGYTKVSATQKIYRLTRTSTNGRCSRCGAGMISYKSYWGVIADDGTIYVYDIHDCSHCGNCSFGYTACHNGHENELEDEGKTITFTAWVPNKYTITFNPDNGGNTFTGTAVYGTGDCNVASSYNPTLDGYSFGGWYTGADGTGEQVYDKDGKAVNGTYWSGNGSTAVWKGTTNISVYAYWTAADTDVTLYFYKDGVKDDSKTKTYSVKNGSTFNATDHAADSTFDNCHYVSVDRTSWKVPDEGTYASVYYETNELNVMYEGNGNTGGSTDGSSVKYDSTVTIAGNGFTKTGHSFNGWNTSADGTGTSYPAGSTFISKPSAHGDTLKLFAQWKADRWGVTLIAGTGIDSVSGGGSHAYNENVAISAAVKKGYSWDKWTGYAETSSNSYRFNMPASDVSFTANAVPNKYTVTFDANGGSCVDGSGQAVQSVTVTYGSPDYNDISGNVKAVRTGYTFAGWVSDAAGSRGTVWNSDGHAVDGSYWSISGNSTAWIHAGSITVHAEWKDATPPAVNVSPESTSSYTTSLGVTITVTDNELLSTDNTYEYCLGTDSSAPPSGASWSSYRSGVPVTIGSTLSGACYLWVKHVKDAAGNTSVSSPNADYHRFGPYYFDNTAPDLGGVLSSYGWYPEGTAVPFDISDAHSGIKSAVLTDFNGIQLDNGDITSGRQYYFGSEGPAFYCLTVTDNMGNTAKKLFVVKIDSKGEVIPDNAVWKGLGNLALFAHWSANSYTVHFEKNDNDSGSTRAVGSMSDATFTYDRDETLPANGFSRTGYYFDGWNESADGTAGNGRNYPDRAAVKNLTLIPNGLVTLHAQWKPCSYTLTFNYNKPGNATGTLRDSDEASRTVTFDASIGRLPEPKLTGWTFEGWYIENADGTSVKIGDNEIWHYTSGKTAAAKWTPAKYEVRLHSSVPAEALGTLVKPSDRELTSSVWKWKENEYYSAVFTYDTESLLPAAPDTYSIVYTAGGQDTTEYAISGWYRNKLLSDYTGGGETRKWNFSAADGVVIDLYPSWRDTSAPVIDVTPAHTINPDADNDAVRSIDITITVTEYGSGLRTDNSYEYGFSASASALPSEWESYGSAASSPSGFTTSLPDLGASMDGYYYLWVRQVMDNSGSLSVSPSALATVNSCHVYGIYVFDNTAPSGKTEYTENNLTLGLYNDSITDSPYAVMTIHDPHDDIAGIAGYVLRVSDAADPSNSVDLAFTPDDGTGTYICRFNLYDSLLGAEDIEQVRMCIVSKDKLGNEATIPITRYDFGTLQTGAAIRAEDIGYRELSDIPDASSPPLPTSYKYIRDYFRVEAYIENISYKASGTTFMGGHKGQLRIYVFGYVDNVSANFGSIKKFILPAYDTNPDLSRTDIVPPEREKLYLHEFFVPLYCANSTYTDTTAFGYKRNSVQKRCVIYDVSDTLAYKIKTILKYNAK